MDPIQSWLDAAEVRRMAESLMAPAPEVDQSAIDAGYGDDFEGFADSVNSEDSQSEEVVSPAPKEEVVSSAPKEELVSPELDSEPSEPRTSISTKITMGHALADAKRMAEGSGMLTQQEEDSWDDDDLSPEDEVLDIALNPETNTKVMSQTPVGSPFQLSEDQSEDEEVPLARQISPPTAPVSQATNGSGGARGPFLARLKQFSELLRERTEARAMFLIDNEGQILIDEVGNAKLIQVARTLANASHSAERQTAGAADVGNLHVKIGASATLEVIPCRSRYGLLILGVVCPAPMGADIVQQVAVYLEKTVEPTHSN